MALSSPSPGGRPPYNRDNRRNNDPFAAIRRNMRIKSPQVRVISPEGRQLGIMDTQKAIALALQFNLDLVEVAAAATPPVCRIMDFGKFLFEANKKAHAAKRKQKQIQIKEIKFRPGTEEGDYQIKLRNLIRFLTEGDKAKVVLRFRGREMAHQEIGRELLERVQQDLSQVGTVEQFPVMEGRQLVMLVGPKKK